VTFIDATRDGKFSKFTPRVGVNYKATSDVLLYASYSQGFKQGGFNGRPLATAAEVTRYNPEVLDSYEVGMKSQWLDRALTANIALFHSIYKDIQLTVNQTPQNFVANAAKGRINGMELELVARPVRWFSVNGAIGYTDAHYTAVGQGLGPTQILPITINSHFVKAPKWTTSVGAEVSHRMEDGSNLTLRGDLSTYSKIYNDVANTPLITENGYVLVNARLSYSFAGDKITVAVFGTNLTNSLYLVSGNASGGFGLAEGSYGRPREWGISAGFKF
jgi:iron complex outermembrane receptor protein